MDFFFYSFGNRATVIDSILNLKKIYEKKERQVSICPGRHEPRLRQSAPSSSRVFHSSVSFYLLS